MPKFVNWEDATAEAKSERGGDTFLKLVPGNKYRIRLISKPVRYMQHWEPVICRSPGVDPESKQVIDPLMLLGYKPKKRFAIWVLDREDGNKIKLMDFPQQLLDCFSEWKAMYNNEEPGGKNGPDFVIKLELPGGDRRRTKYKAVALEGRTPFTDDELKRINEGKLKDKIQEFRREHTPDEIRAMMAAKQGGVQPQVQGTQAPSSRPRPRRSRRRSPPRPRCRPTMRLPAC